MCSPDIEVRVSRTLFVAQYPGRLRGLVLQAGIQQTARQVAGFELVTAQCVFNNSIWSTRLGQNSANWIRSKYSVEFRPTGFDQTKQTDKFLVR